jgi:hypothetical protein
MKFLLWCWVALIAPLSYATVFELDGHMIDEATGSLASGLQGQVTLQTPYKVTKSIMTLTSLPTNPSAFSIDFAMYALDGQPAVVPLTNKVVDTNPLPRSISMYNGIYRGGNVDGAIFKIDVPLALSIGATVTGSHFTEVGSDGLTYEKTVSHYAGTLAVPQPGLYAQSVVLVPEPTCLAGLFGSLFLFLRRPFRRATV